MAFPPAEKVYQRTGHAGTEHVSHDITARRPCYDAETASRARKPGHAYRAQHDVYDSRDGAVFRIYHAGRYIYTECRKRDGYRTYRYGPRRYRA